MSKIMNTGALPTILCVLLTAFAVWCCLTNPTSVDVPSTSNEYDHHVSDMNITTGFRKYIGTLVENGSTERYQRKLDDCLCDCACGCQPRLCLFCCSAKTKNETTRA